MEVLGMTKTEIKRIALDTIMESLSMAYYRVCDVENIPEDDKPLIYSYMNQYGERIAKYLGTTYYTQ